MSTPTKSWLIDVGNSTKGQIGFCARVQAKTRAEAIATLEDALETATGPFSEVDLEWDREQHPEVEYMTVYFGHGNFKPRHAGEPEPVDECSDCDECGALIAEASELVNDQHATSCSLHPSAQVN